MLHAGRIPAATGRILNPAGGIPSPALDVPGPVGRIPGAAARYSEPKHDIFLALRKKTMFRKSRKHTSSIRFYNFVCADSEFRNPLAPRPQNKLFGL